VAEQTTITPEAVVSSTIAIDAAVNNTDKSINSVESIVVAQDVANNSSSPVLVETTTIAAGEIVKIATTDVPADIATTLPAFIKVDDATTTLLPSVIKVEDSITTIVSPTEKSTDEVVVTEKVIVIDPNENTITDVPVVEETYPTTKNWIPDTSLAAEHKEFEDLLIVTTQIPPIVADALESITENILNVTETEKTLTTITNRIDEIIF